MPFLQERYVEIMSLASTSLQSLTVLTQDDGVPGSKFESEAENYTVDQLKRWLKCRGLKLRGKRDDLVKRVTECIKAGKHHTGGNSKLPQHKHKPHSYGAKRGDKKAQP